MSLDPYHIQYTMPILKFPDPRSTGPEGLVALGADLSPETLILAYRQGIFPWPVEGVPTLTWFCPPKRGVLIFSELHLPRSLKSAKNKTPYLLTLNQAFAEVICECQKAYRPGQPGTWITDEMKEAYIRLHELKIAHSAEAWQRQPDGSLRLVGGLYGVEIDGAFAGESMFYLEPNASKLALLHLIDTLKTRGIEWMDIQMTTPHMERLGAREISRDDFLEKLSQTHRRWLARHRRPRQP